MITPVTMIDSSNFNLLFQVYHPYTIVQYSSPGLDFIDSIRMINFYSRKDSIILQPDYIPSHPGGTISYNYMVNKLLDTTLLKDGFVFNYKFYAKDKGIIPESAWAPDTGYYRCIWGTPSFIQNDSLHIPQQFKLNQNYPNPFNPSTRIRYEIPYTAVVLIKVYDILGNEIEILVNEEKPAGQYEVNWRTADLPSGIYFCELRAGSYIDTKKMILMK